MVLGASGIFGFGMGRKRTDNLFSAYPDILENYSKLSKTQLLDKISNIEGFSDITAQQVVDNISWADMFIHIMKTFATFKEKVVLSDALKDRR